MRRRKKNLPLCLIH